MALIRRSIPVQPVSRCLTSVSRSRLKRCLLSFTAAAFILQLYAIPKGQGAPAGPKLLDRSSDVADSANQIQYIVQEAVNKSLGNTSALTANSTFTELINKIVENLLSAGIEGPELCKPKPLDTLRSQFLTDNINYHTIPISSSTSCQSGSNSSCLQLDRLITHYDEDIYYVGSRGSAHACTKTAIEVQSACYGTRGEPNKCSIGSEIQPIRPNSQEDYFPKFKLQITCGGCARGDMECRRQHGDCYAQKIRREFYPLKRVLGECGEDGFEKWTLDSKSESITVACNCITGYAQ